MTDKLKMQFSRLLAVIIIFFGMTHTSFALNAAGVLLYAPCPNAVNQWCILLSERAYGAVGTFATLGGFVEPGESLETAAVREVSEESGYLYHFPPSQLDRVQVRYEGIYEEFYKSTDPKNPNPPSYASKENESKKLKAVVTESSSDHAAVGDQKVQFSLFFKEVPYANPSDLLVANQKYNEKRGKNENPSFAWVPVRNILNAVKNGDDSVSQDRKDPKDSEPKLRLMPQFKELLAKPEMTKYLQEIQEKPMATDLMKKAMVNLELKSNASLLSSAKLSNEISPRFSQFESYTKAKLREKYDEHNTVKNVDAMIALHNSQVPEDWANRKDITAVKIEPHSYARQRLINMAQKEREMLPWMVFYHALPNDWVLHMIF